MNTFIISPAQNLIEEIISNLVADGLDYSANIVVFPGRRPAHFLRKAMSEKIGSSLIPPVIFSMDDFIDHLYGLKRNDRKLDAIDAAALLFDIHKGMPDRLGSGSFLEPDTFFPVSLKIFRDIEELYIEGISPEKVRGIDALASETVPEKTLKRLQSLSFFYEEFYRKIEAGKYSTRSYRYRYAASNFSAELTDSYKSVILAGFYAFTQAENELCRKLLACNNSKFFFQSGMGLKARLEGLGIKIQETEESPLPKVQFYGSPDTHGQALALGSLLDEMRPSLDTNTVVVLPSPDTLFPVLRQPLAGWDKKSFNVSIGYPLVRTPLFGFMNNLMELVTSMDDDRVYIPAYLNFVLHPYTKNIYFEHGRAELTRIMFHTIEEVLQEERTRKFITLPELEADSLILEKILKKMPHYEKDLSAGRISGHLKSVHDNTIRRFLSFQDVGAFGQTCSRLLEYIFNNSSAKLHPLFHPFSEAFIKALDELSRSLMKDIRFKERASYFSFFKRYISSCHSPFEGTPIRGLQVLGFLETRNLNFERVIIMDVNEDVLPDTSREDSLMPFKAREILGIPTYIDRDRLASYYFDLLCRGAKEVHLFFRESDKHERSRFVEKLLWDLQVRDREKDAKRYIRQVQYRVDLKNSMPMEICKDDETTDFLKGFAFSATALNAYLRCPIRFYYSYVLGLRKQDEVSEGLENREIGIVVHDVLSKYFGNKLGRVLHREDIDKAEMGRLAEELFRGKFGAGPTGAVYLLKRQIKKHLNELLNNYFIPLVDGNKISVLGVEEKISAQDFGSFKIKGAIDMIQKRGDEHVIVDYKISSDTSYLNINMAKLDISNRESWNKAIKSIQLPFYLLLYAAKSGIRIEDMNGMFLLLGKSSLDNKIELPLFSEKLPKSDFKMLEAVIAGLLNELTDPAVPFKPAYDRKNECPICDFAYICGTQWITKPGFGS